MINYISSMGSCRSSLLKEALEGGLTSEAASFIKLLHTLACDYDMYTVCMRIGCIDKQRRINIFFHFQNV